MLNFFGLKLPPEDLTFPVGEPLLEHLVASEPVAPDGGGDVSDEEADAPRQDYDVQDTSGVDAHMAPVAIHTVMACYPLCLLAVAHGAARPAAPNGAAPTGKGATRPLAALVRAWGRSCSHTPCPRPRRVAPWSIHPYGKAIDYR